MFLVLLLLLSFVSLSVFFYVGTLFFQGYFYTEPTPGLAWQAPAAGAILSLFVVLWAFVVTRSDAMPGNIPYDTIFRFSPKVDLVADPVKQLWVVGPDGKATLFTSRVNDNLSRQYKDGRGQPYRPRNVASIEIEHEGTKLKFEPGPGNEGNYRTFTSVEGWQMQEFEEGPTGIPSRFRWGRFLTNLFLNGLHLALWVVCLWLLLRFSLSHALGLGLVIWIFMSVALLPMLLDVAAGVARDRGNASTAETHRVPLHSFYC